MKEFDEWWNSYEFDPGTIDEAFEDAFRAGLLAAADVADNLQPEEYTHPHGPTAISKEIRNHAGVK